VLTRNSALAYLSTVTVAPVTSTIRGVPSEVVLNEEDGMKSPCAVSRLWCRRYGRPLLEKREKGRTPSFFSANVSQRGYILAADSGHPPDTVI
jgi:hypothetical protein